MIKFQSVVGQEREAYNITGNNKQNSNRASCDAPSEVSFIGQYVLIRKEYAGLAEVQLFNDIVMKNKTSP